MARKNFSNWTCRFRSTNSQVWSCRRSGPPTQIPIKNDSEVNERALDKVRQDKLREVRAGHRARLGPERFDSGRFELAARLFDEMMTREDFQEFMKLAAYEYLN